MKKYIAAICMAAVLLCCLPLRAAAERPTFLNDEEWAVLQRTNAERTAHGAAPVSTFAKIHQAAEVRAEESATLFSHTRPNGTNCFTALREAGVGYSSAGENLAKGHLDPADAVQGWMNSTTGHRENLLNTTHKHLGAGHYAAAGSNYNYWTQFFVGGCTTTALANGGVAPQFDTGGTLTNDPILKVTCNHHGDSYLPLADTTYSYLGNNTYQVTYDGITATLSCNGYPDVDETLWYAPGVRYVSEQGLMQGMPGGTFAPERNMTRAQFVTILYRMSGAEQTGDDGFTDVSPGDWFYEEVHWAAKTGLVNGMGDGTFAPDTEVSRAEMATILLRYHKKSNSVSRAEISGFPDAAAVQAWAKEAMEWAVAEGVLSGSLDHATGQTLLLPQGNTTRAQIATVLMRYLSE